MLYSTETPAAKREALRAGLASGTIQRFPGAFNPLSAKLIESKGFDGVYISGAVLAADLGLPDIGLTTLTEVATRAQQIARMTNLPAIVDADTGFGEPMNVARTIQTLEDAGLAGTHIEDQVNPKRCGHLDGKQVTSVERMSEKVTAARAARTDLVVIARTDARATHGFDEAVARGRAYLEAGADVIFPEALETVEEFRDYAAAVDAPLLANMTEFGRSPALTASELGELGYRLVIFPVSAARVAAFHVGAFYGDLLEQGSAQPWLDRMQTRDELYDLLDYGAYADLDAGVARPGGEEDEP